MKMKNLIWSVTLAMFILSSCQSSTTPPSPLQSTAETETNSQPVIDSTTTPQPATKAPTVTPTLIPVTKKSLAGLIISSPILGVPLEVPGVQPSTMITPNGLGIINSKGELIKFADAGLFESFSPSGIQIVYQHGFEDEYYDYIDNLFVYNSMTGETVEIFDDLEYEGGKTVISWSQDEQQFIYYNDYLTVLFEAFGYFAPKQLLLADVSTGQTISLINDGYQFDISPDRSQIAYTTGELIDIEIESDGGKTLGKFGCFQPHIYDITSSSSQPFNVSSLNEKPVCLGYPKWSPDGREIAWIGYFENNTFRPIIFDLDDKVGHVYEVLDQKPIRTNLPTSWYFGEPYFGGRFEPDWVGDYIFWTPSYEVNTETGKASTPRELEVSGNPKWAKYYIESPDGSFNVSLSEERDVIILSDDNENLLASFLVDDVYNGPRQEILTSGFFLPGRTYIAGWSTFAPP
ncbi:MAG: hypothetical protein FIB03_13500 [Anaerolineae bacterium]|nr:hypothetical protein [Anaerolineae bacterium]